MNKTKLLLFLILLLTSIKSYSQLNIGGLPKSFTDDIKNILLKNIDSVKMPYVNVEKLKTEDVINDVKGNAPWRFGKLLKTNITPENSGTWDLLPDSSKIWRVAIESTGALSINLRFDKYILPKNAVLYIYSADKKEIIGGFTSANNQQDSIFATGLIKSDKIIIEYYEPKNVTFSGIIKIGAVTHGYRGVKDYNKSFGDSGDCNLNVACDDGTYADQIKSVCMLVIGGFGFCTGSLINNTLENGTPYILTANHCYTDPSSLVFMFNWQSETCVNPILSPAHDDLSGALFISKNSDSDFCLYKMNDVPPYTYNVYYAGWNAEDVPSTKSVGIHHPQGDIKKISYDDDPSVSDYYLSNEGLADSHWKILWDRSTTTEPGSSGSPLFDQNGRVTGQLHGGYAACDNLTGADYYGKFSTSWNYGSTPETRLKDWLDPLNIGVTTINGYDPNTSIFDYDAQMLKINIPESLYIEEQKIKPSFKIRNRGNITLTLVTVKYFIDSDIEKSLTFNTNLASGEITDLEFLETNIYTGEHSITAYVENPNGVIDQYPYNDTLKTTFIVYSPIFSDDFEKGNIWLLSNEFEIGKPLALGGEKAFPDPQNAYSGDKILGLDLSGLGEYPGDYEKNLTDKEAFAISPVIDCSAFTNTRLNFQRYLNIEGNLQDNAYIQLYSDSSWHNIWQNPENNIEESNWTEQNFDISNYADGKRIRIKFALGSTNDLNQYSGWNIDNFIVCGEYQKQISDTIVKPKILIYPNPSERYFNIEINKIPTKNLNISISNILGKTILIKDYSLSEINYSENLSEKKIILNIDLKNSSGGLFIVKINIDGITDSKKIFLMKNK